MSGKVSQEGQKEGVEGRKNLQKSLPLQHFSVMITGALPAAACSCVSSCAWMGLGDAPVKCLLVLLQGMETRQCTSGAGGCPDILGAGLSGQPSDTEVLRKIK